MLSAMTLKFEQKLGWKSMWRSTTMILTLALAIASTGCQFRTPAPVTPLTNSGGERISKAFFFKNGQFSAASQMRQNFLVSWAPLDTSGYYGERILEKGVPQAGHVNIQWDITETSLIGYRVNPSYVGKTTTMSKIAFIEIPIISHYYYEREKDDLQRETNRWIKNDKRDAYMYRPYMDLDFKGMRINGPEFSLAITGTGVEELAGSAQIMDVHDYEWDRKKPFLGFTVEAKNAMFAEYAQAQYRFNFMAFDSDPKFKTTPANSANSRFINVLHKFGKTENGVDHTESFAGHWKLPVTFYTYGVTPEYMDVVRSVIDGWNKAFDRAGITVKNAQGKIVPALSLNETPLKYPFDLRYPVINWNSDRRASMFGPLGIGAAAGDVATGQFLHGSVNIWSGILDEYMNKYVNAGTESPASAAAFMAMSKRSQGFNLKNMFNDLPQFPLKPLVNGNGVSNLSDYLKSPAAVDKLLRTVNLVNGRTEREFTTQKINELSQSNPELAARMQSSLLENRSQTNNTYEALYTQTIDGDLLQETSFPQAKDLKQTLKGLFSGLIRDENQSQTCSDQNSVAGMCEMSGQNIVSQASNMAEFYATHDPDLEYTMAQFVSQMSMTPAGSIQDEQATLRAVLKLLTMHELGHVLGLGHNFKGNVLPERGTIPDSIYLDLKKTYLAHKQDPTLKEVSTTVMDYGSPISYANLKSEDIQPGPYDEMMLRYLYLAKYPAIDENNPNDLRYFDVPPGNGVIPDFTTVTLGGVTTHGHKHEPNRVRFKTAFLPGCNDLDASTNVDPYCIRWDRGATAEEIVKYRFQDLNATLPAMLNAFSGAKGGDGEMREASLWNMAMANFAQTRTFYDLMRAMLDSPHFPYRDAFAHIRSNPQALFTFSRACMDPTLAPDGFRDDFAKLALRDPSKVSVPKANLEPDDYTTIHDLCAANELALAQWGSLLTRKGSDHNTVDIFRRYSELSQTGGEASLDWSHVWGAYKEIGSFPLRMATLFTVTTPKPIFVWGGMEEVPIFAGNEQSYSYASLYPLEFSSIISTTVRENLNFGGGQLDSPIDMGSTLLYLNYFLQRNRVLGKDTFNRFPTTYIDNLSGLTNFEITISPIILTNVVDPDKPAYLVYKYKAEYVDSTKKDPVGIPWAYVLPDRRVIAKGIDKQMFLPLSKFRYLADTWGYVWALDLRYQDSALDDGLRGNNAKVSLSTLYQTQMDSCFVSDDGTGLSAFFTNSNPDFKGFKVQTGIAFSEGLQGDYVTSLNAAYATYYDSWNLHGKRPDRRTCDQAQKGIGLIASAAALMNGVWIPEATPYTNE